MSKDRNTQDRLDQMEQAGLEGARKRSVGQKLKRAIDAPWNFIGYLFKALVLLGVPVLIIGGIIYSGALHGVSSNSPASEQTISEKTIAPDGKTASDSPSKPTTDDLQPAAKVTDAEWLVGTQLMNLHLAVTDCLNSREALRMTARQEAAHCSEPSNLPGGGFVLGGGIGQVDANLSIDRKVVRKGKQVSWEVTEPDGSVGHTVYSTVPVETVVSTLTGQSNDGQTLTLADGSSLVTDDAGAVDFWINEFPQPPCPNVTDGQACIVQPTVIEGTAVTEWAPRVVNSDRSL